RNISTSIQSSMGVMVMQSNLCVHTKYENMEEIYLYPIWEFLEWVLQELCENLESSVIRFLNSFKHLRRE
ncbi:hypothetical protein DRN97_05350, partial [Methanosarcinales archaeon]